MDEAEAFVARMPRYPWRNQVHRQAMVALFQEALTQGQRQGLRRGAEIAEGIEMINRGNLTDDEVTMRLLTLKQIASAIRRMADEK